MPRFHFNVHDGVAHPDASGAVHATWQDAQVEAIRLAGAILREEATRVAVGEDWHMEVTDESGLVLFRLAFTLTHAPAMLYAAHRRRDPA